MVLCCVCDHRLKNLNVSNMFGLYSGVRMTVIIVTVWRLGGSSYSDNNAIPTTRFDA